MHTKAMERTHIQSGANRFLSFNVQQKRDIEIEMNSMAVYRNIIRKMQAIRRIKVQ